MRKVWSIRVLPFAGDSVCGELDHRSFQDGTRLFEQLSPRELSEGLARLPGSTRQEAPSLGALAHHDLELLGHGDDVQARDEVVGRYSAGVRNLRARIVHVRLLEESRKAAMPVS
nr:hypothetical protein [Nocardioides furvisabuli]